MNLKPRSVVGNWLQHPLLKGYALAICAGAGFGFATAMTKAGSVFEPSADFLNIAFWGWGGGMVMATALTSWRPHSRTEAKKILQDHRPLWITLAGMGLINSVLWFHAITFVEGGILAVLDLSIILWSFVLGLLFLGEKFHWREVPGILLAIGGIFLISSLKQGVSWPGVAMIFAANLCLALQSLILKKYPKPINALALTFCRAWLMWSCFAVYMIVFDLINFSFGWPFLIMVAVGQFLGVFVARGAYIWAHEYLPISRLSLILLLKPPVVLFLTWWWIHEPLSGQKLLGATLTLAGLAWFIMEQKRLKSVG